ncbi:hypothetical protein ZIOFF_011907 [Zingiber officinale]|uniref:Uncharacterized protein n=1 Tax=Zingiber officinale TaxID=94328 RepID=A0A8J5HNP7_ZINOF|nr:hypothetical protein ZIOFF_011907 [Zingiber officinale]
MKRGGQLIYSGPLGNLSKNMRQYFEAIPGVPMIIDGQNPATWMLNVTSPAMEYKLGIDFGTIYRNSSLHNTAYCGKGASLPYAIAQVAIEIPYVWQTSSGSFCSWS